MKCYIKDYPRPQLVRKDWKNLNGKWKFWYGDEEQPPLASGGVKSIAMHDAFAPNNGEDGVSSPGRAYTYEPYSSSAPESDASALLSSHFDHPSGNESSSCHYLDASGNDGTSGNHLPGGGSDANENESIYGWEEVRVLSPSTSADDVLVIASF